MSMTVDGGAGRAKPAATPAPSKPATAPAEPKKADGAAPAAKPESSPAANTGTTSAPAPQAPADGYQKTSKPAEEPVALGSRNTGEEIPTALQQKQWSAESKLSAADFADTATTGGPGTGNPQINVDAVQGATFQQVQGQPFIQGAGDANAVAWNDIQQGQLGDCYFMSSLGSIAQQNPDVIRNAITDNGDGTYTVRLYEREGSGPLGIGGLFGDYNYKPVDITVSGDFPMQNGQPVFAGMLDADGANRELWPAIMEKAFAQHRGSYGSISGGNAARAMEMLTGKPSTERAASDVTLEQLDQAFRAGNAIVADSLQNGDKKTPYANGTLVGKHSYMVTGVDTANGTVSLRNPWGPNTPDITMPIADFNRYFDDVNFNPTR